MPITGDLDGSLTTLLGESFVPYVDTQIKARQYMLGKEYKTDEELLYLNNNGAFINLYSSVNILNDAFARAKLESIPIDFEKYKGVNLAEQFALRGGVEKRIPETFNFEKRSNILDDSDSDDANIWDDVYGLGGMDFGHKPMPGITSINVETVGSNGSLKRATINIKAYNKQQFDIIELLYLRLGYNVLLSYGHVFALLVDEDNYKSYSIVPNKDRGIANWYASNSLTTVKKAIQKGKREQCGNYDGFVGKVSNYNFTVDENGIYSIVLKLVSSGDLLDSLTANDKNGIEEEESYGTEFKGPYILNGRGYSDINSCLHWLDARAKGRNQHLTIMGYDSIYSNWIDLFVSDPTKYANDITVLNRNIHTKCSFIRQFARVNQEFIDNITVTNADGTTSIPEDIEDRVEQNKDGPSFFKFSFISLEGYLQILNEFALFTDKTSQGRPSTKLETGYNDLLIFDNTKGQHFAMTHPYQLSGDPQICIIKGNVKGLSLDEAQRTAARTVFDRPQEEIEELDAADDDLLYETVTNFTELRIRWLGKNHAFAPTYDGTDYKYKSNADLEGQELLDYKEKFEEAKANTIAAGEISGFYMVSSADGSGYWYEFPGKSPEFLVINDLYDYLGGEYEVFEYNGTYDPPIRVKTEDHERYDEEVTEFQKDIQIGGDQMYDFKNKAGEIVYGDIMNIYLNTEYLSKILVNNDKDRFGNISIRNHVIHILDDVSQALGGINRFRLKIDDDVDGPSKAYIYDELAHPATTELAAVMGKRRNRAPSLFNVNGFYSFEDGDGVTTFGSFVRKFNFKSKLGNNLAAFITIGAQSKGYLPGFDATAFSAWNLGLQDRFVTALERNNNFITNLNNSEIQTTRMLGNLLYVYNALYNQDFDLPLDSLQTSKSILKKYLEADIATFILKGQKEVIDSGDTTSIMPSSPTIGFIPLDLELQMDGLSGAKIFQKFTIPGQFLPRQYPKQFDFVITKYQHTVDSKGWITKINSLTIPKPLGQNIDSTADYQTASDNVNFNRVVNYGGGSSSGGSGYTARSFGSKYIVNPGTGDERGPIGDQTPIRGTQGHGEKIVQNVTYPWIPYNRSSPDNPPGDQIRATSYNPDIDTEIAPIKGTTSIVMARKWKSYIIADANNPDVLNQPSDTNSSYGNRGPNHSGEDMPGKTNHCIVVNKPGKIIYRKDTNRPGSYGNEIAVLFYGYGAVKWSHLSNDSPKYFDWKVEDEVKPGQVVGLVGSTGRSSGPHIHHEFWEGEALGTPNSQYHTGREGDQNDPRFMTWANDVYGLAQDDPNGALYIEEGTGYHCGNGKGASKTPTNPRPAPGKTTADVEADLRVQEAKADALNPSIPGLGRPFNSEELDIIFASKYDKVRSKAINNGYQYTYEINDSDLETTHNCQEEHKCKLSKTAAAAFYELAEAMKKEIDVELYVLSGYRSVKKQESILKSSIGDSLNDDAKISRYLSTRSFPGTSTHHTGRVGDFCIIGGSNCLTSNFTELSGGDVYRWLDNNAYRYGWRMTYPPEADIQAMGATWEPWHWEYVGDYRELQTPNDSI